MRKLIYDLLFKTVGTVMMGKNNIEVLIGKTPKLRVEWYLYEDS